MTSNSDVTSYKIQTAVKLKIPVVPTRYLTECDAKQQYFEPDGFLLVGKSATESFMTGKIAAKRSRVEAGPAAIGGTSTGIKRLKTTASLRDAKATPYLDPKSPAFDEGTAAVAKKAVLVRDEVKLGVTYFVVLELHARQAGASGSNSVPFRVFTHSGTLPRDGEAKIHDSVKECRFFGSVWDAEDIYAQLYTDLEKKGFKKGSVGSGSGRVGSNLLQQESQTGESTLPEGIKSLVDEIFAEADAELAETMNEELGVPTLQQIEEGEGRLVCYSFVWKILMQTNPPFFVSFSVTAGHHQAPADSRRGPTGKTRLRLFCVPLLLNPACLRLFLLSS